MKHEWKKREKQIYLPKEQPEMIEVPRFKFFMLKGEGNPNLDFFAEYVGVLYSLAYAVKMSPKHGQGPKGYMDYTVYPLEGVWDLKEAARASFDGHFNKDDLGFTLMIRQPDFVGKEFALEIIENTKKKKPHALLDHVQFEEFAEGLCVQMLHKGSYDKEPESFAQMESYVEKAGYRRVSLIHREIYLSDPRKVSPEKLKTVLRFKAI